jgi:hypothetical protein
MMRSSAERVHTSNYEFPEFAIYFKGSSGKHRTIEVPERGSAKVNSKSKGNRKSHKIKPNYLC